MTNPTADHPLQDDTPDRPHTGVPSFTNVSTYLTLMADRKPYQAAVVFPNGTDSSGRMRYCHYTFRQLEDETNRIGHGLIKSGFTPGMRTVLMVKPSLELFALTFAFLKTGIIPIMVDPGMGIKKLKICFEESEPEAFAGIPHAHIARILFGWGKRTIRRLITVGKRWAWSGLTLHRIRRSGENTPFFDLSRPDPDDRFRSTDIAAINFTSGSTGVPKGAIYTHGIFSAQVTAIRNAYHIEPGEIDLCTFPLFALFAPALGMTAIIPDMDATRPAMVNPRKIHQAIDDFGPTNMFGSPALLNAMGRYVEAHGILFPTLRRVIAAGAPVHPSIMKRFTRCLNPGTHVHSGYGATEAMPLASIDSGTVLGETQHLTDRGHGICLGYPLQGIDLRIITISDEPIPEWSDDLQLPQDTIGEIAVCGPVVTRSYHNRPDSNRLAKIIIPGKTDFFHRMGDLGYLDAQHRLWFCGRKSHRVVAPDRIYFTICCEGVFNSHPHVYRSALAGVYRDGIMTPVICIELEKGVSHRDHYKIREELLTLAQQYNHTRRIDTFLFHPGFPVDIRHNSKIFREKLAVWAKERLS